MSRLFVDTVFVVALINRNDQYHEQAVLLADTYDGQPLLVTDSVLLEVGNALARSFKPQAVRVIDELLSSPETELVRLNERLFAEAFNLFRSHADKAWGLIDCVSFVVMKEAGVVEALTNDWHFQQAGFRALMREAWASEGTR